jgi:hypothetical protein
LLFALGCGGDSDKPYAGRGTRADTAPDARSSEAQQPAEPGGDDAVDPDSATAPGEGDDARPDTSAAVDAGSRARDGGGDGSSTSNDAGAREAGTRDAEALDGAHVDTGVDTSVVDAAADAASSAPDAASSDAGNSTRPAYAAGWGDQPCTQASTKPGCHDDALALCICRGPEAEGGNSFCCSERWSYLCVDGVAGLPECKFVTRKFCEAHPTDGCEDPAIEQCVCNEVQRMKQAEVAAGRSPDSVHDCCTQGWSGFCTILADSACNAGCPSL